MKIKGVKKGDLFTSRNTQVAMSKDAKTYEVVAVCEVVDIETKEVIDYKCYARGIDTLAKNVFEIPFSTVVINKITQFIK